MKLSSYNLVMSAVFGGRQGQRPPVGNPTSIACHGLMEKAGVSFPTAHLDAGAMADLAMAGWEVLGFDTVMPEYSVVQEAAALGAPVDWGDRDKMPDVKAFPNADFNDIVIPVDFLEKPSCRVVLDAISMLRRQVGGRVAILGKVMGPWTLSYHMAGTQNFLLTLGMGEKAKVTKMLRQLMPATIAFPLVGMTRVVSIPAVVVFPVPPLPLAIATLTRGFSQTDQFFVVFAAPIPLPRPLPDPPPIPRPAPRPIRVAASWAPTAASQP